MIACRSLGWEEDHEEEAWLGVDDPREDYLGAELDAMVELPDLLPVGHPETDSRVIPGVFAFSSKLPHEARDVTCVLFFVLYH